MRLEDTMDDGFLNLLFKLSMLANVLQIANFEMNFREVTNDELMKALEFQNAEYLEIIIRKQDEIIELLKNKNESENS